MNALESLSGGDSYSNQEAVVSLFISTPQCPTFGSSRQFPCSIWSTSALLQHAQSIQPSQSFSCCTLGSLVPDLAPTASIKDQPPTGKRKLGDHLRGANGKFTSNFKYPRRTILRCIHWKVWLINGKRRISWRLPCGISTSKSDQVFRSAVVQYPVGQGLP